MNSLKVGWVVAACVMAWAGAPCALAIDLRYARVGNAANASAAAPKAGFALMGGGKDLDEAFRWLCDRAGGGDFLVLRASGTDDYNAYVQKLCPQLNSVATLVIPNREAANDSEVAQIVAHASALFISGGDQANYINFWMGTPVQSALNEAIRRSVPVGGTSAGLAVMGEWAYSAQEDKPGDPNLDSGTALSNRDSARVTLVHGFLSIPVLKGIITDTHFARRNRMGRLLVFVTHLNEPDGKAEPPPGEPPVRGIGIEEGAAVLVAPDGEAAVVGRGSAYLVDPIDNGFFAEPGEPVEIPEVTVHKVAPGHTFNLKTWTGDADSYRLFVHKGRLRSRERGGAIY